MKKPLLALTFSVFAVGTLAVAQEIVDLANDEELDHSQIMRTPHMLTDRFGPRVTGTPNHELAAKWAVAELTRWGTGRIRGASVFGPTEAPAVTRPVLAQFAEWGVGGALPSSSRAVGGTEHLV